MAKAKLSKWIFQKDEIATLYWLSSPWKVTPTGAAYMSADFLLENKSFQRINLPWGDLPISKMGYQYCNAEAMGPTDNLISGTLFIHNTTKLTIETAYKAISPKLYPLKPQTVTSTIPADQKNALKGTLYEHCLKFTQNRLTYIIPCIEATRAIYADKAFLANRLISTDGLEQLTISENVVGNRLEIDFSADYPQKFLNDASISEYVWLKYTNAYDAYRAIYTQFVATNKIIAELPRQSGIQYHYQGIKNGATILILNLELHNLDIPFSEIVISHPRLREKSGEQPSNKVKIVQSNTTDAIVQNADATTNKQDALLVDSGAPSKVFRSRPRIQKKTEPYTAEKRNKIYVEDPSEHIYSTQDSTAIGKARSLDFATTDGKDKPHILMKAGFEKFCAAIRCVQRVPTIANVAIRYGEIRGDGAFAQMPNGSKREYAVANIDFASGRCCAVIELNRTDGWSVFTLIVRNTENCDRFADFVIDKLTAAGGHWSKSMVAETYCYPLRHGERSPERWAELILNHCQ